jgi:hypothetical protein
VTSRLAELYGIEATAELLRELRAERPDGVRLRRRNIETPAQVRELAASLRKEFGERFEIAVRHEGGVQTPFVRGVTAFPGLEALEAAGNAGLARDVGRAVGSELSAMGVNVNLVMGTGPMAMEYAVGLRCSGVKAGPGPVAPGGARAVDEAESAALALAVAEASLRVGRDPLKLMPVAQGRRVGLLVPRLGDVADRLPVEDGLRSTASLLRPRVGAGVGVLEIAVQPDERSVAMAVDWLAAQEIAVFLCLSAGRFPGQQRLLDALAQRCPRRVIVTIGETSDETRAGSDAAIVRSCGFQACQLYTALRTIFAPAASSSKRK